MGKLRKSRSSHAIPKSSAAPSPSTPAVSQAAAPAVSTATVSASPIALKTGKSSAATVTSSNHDDYSLSGSPVPTSIDFNVGSPSGTSIQGESYTTKGRPKSVVSKQSSSSLRSSDKDHNHSISHNYSTADTDSIKSNSDPPTGIPASTSASALSLLRERLNEDEAARKRHLEEEAEKAAGPRKLHKKRGPSEANSPPSGIAEETGSVAEEATVVGEDDEESRKVTQSGEGEQTPTPLASPVITAKQPAPVAPSVKVEPIRSRWLPTLASVSPSAVISYATGTVKSTASTAFKVATLPITIPLSIARQVPLIRVMIPAIKESSPAPSNGEGAAAQADAGAGRGQAEQAGKLEHAKADSVGVVWKTAELSLGLGLAAVLVGAAGADFALKKAATWRRRHDKPAGIIH